ncbi:MAG: CRTAC1 family protein [Gammaproteobacteria bacterium]
MRRILIVAGLAATCLQPAAGDEPFIDAAERSGLHFRHFNGMTGELWYVEMMGSGAALFDYDDDGDLDAYLVQGNPLAPPGKADQTIFPPPGAVPLSDRLFRNDSGVSKNGKRELRFTDVTDAAGIEATGYGMGVATGDVNNDGHVDLFVTNFGPNQLLVNGGDGTFSDATAASGISGTNWSVSAAFVDYDRDGLLDLYVGNYVDYTLETHKPCRSTTSARDYCSPLVYEPQVDKLYHNLGGGRFENVSQAAGITDAYGGALGVIAADFNNDGWPDIYVANDGMPNQLWINQRDGSFLDEAVLGGAAVNVDGMPQASMGVDAQDFDDDGDVDLFMTHLTRETNTLYVNNGDGWFDDRSIAHGLAQPSLPFTGFGTAWIDYDNDGLLDVLAVNGAVTLIETQVARGDVYPLKQANQLFRNQGESRYVEVSGQAGAAFALEEVGRGAAFGDVDNDGDTDVLVSNNSGPARLLVNQVGARNAWLGVRLADASGKRDVIGARASLVIDGHPRHWRRVHTDGSYASANDPRILFGLGDTKAPQHVRVQWPDGTSEEWTGLEPGAYHTLEKGSGQAPGE